MFLSKLLIEKYVKISLKYGNLEFLEMSHDEIFQVSKYTLHCVRQLHSGWNVLNWKGDVILNQHWRVCPKMFVPFLNIYIINLFKMTAHYEIFTTEISNWYLSISRTGLVWIQYITKLHCSVWLAVIFYVTFNQICQKLKKKWKFEKMNRIHK